MPMHPSPPADLPALLDAFEQTVQAVINLGWACRDADFEIVTECPGWTVKDQISHVVGAEKAFAGFRRAPIPVPEYEHLRGDFGRLVEIDVEARRTWSGRDVVTELADFHPERMAQLRAATEEGDIDTVIGGFFGPDTTLGEQLRLRIIDVWCHEQDLRCALDRPGDLDSPAAAVFTEAIGKSLPRIAARVAQVPVGDAVVIDVTGPIHAREGVRVRMGDDGRPYGEFLFTGQDRQVGEEQHQVTTIQLTTEALTRRAAGRRTTDEIIWTATGDESLARRMLDALVITP